MAMVENQSDKKGAGEKITFMDTVCVRSGLISASLKRGVNGSLFFVLVLSGILANKPADAADTLRWGTNTVSADIRSTELTTVLERIAAVTGWHVFVEPETLHTVSTKFANLP